LALLMGMVRAEEQVLFLFDMGSEQSPVAPGYVRITPASVFSDSTGYGWIKPPEKAVDVEKPKWDKSWDGPGGQVIPRDIIIYKEHNDLTRDAVAGKSDLVFEIRVPNGEYRVAVTIGDLQRPICSEQIYINDTLVARDVDANHWVRRGAADEQYGFPRKVRATAKVVDGRLRVRVAGDDSGFRERFLKEFDKPIPISYLANRPGRTQKPKEPDLSAWGKSERPGNPGAKVWVWEDIGGPFTENSIMALEVYPYVAPPLRMESKRLVSTSGEAALRTAVELFNAGKFADAEKEFDKVSDDYLKALGYLWLAGRPEYEEEGRLVPKALAILEKLAPGRQRDMMFQETLENARRMDKAIYRFVNRAKQQRTYNELIMITGEVKSMQPEDPTYYKGLIYAGRAMYMIIPHRWTFAAGVGRQMFERVRDGGFPDNRFVKWYLEDTWTEHPQDWIYRDYSALKRNAPEWAAQIYEAYNRELDLAEWWILNRQTPDGALGGGWGDDVEILRSFGSFGSICPDASDIILAGVRKLAEGAWNSGSIDKDAGYFADIGDTEHSGEWTADTLVPMIRIDYGNPVFLERALKTGRLMRDLWMAENSKGQFLMRSNLLGALGVGRGNSRNDSRINYRPALPARAVLWYNGLPTLQKLFVRWADAWLEAAMSTDRGKPRGIIPQEIVWEDGTLGGVGSPSWFKATHDPGTVNYDWEGGGGYHDFIVDLFLLAFDATGDRKYLAPMELEAAYVEQHCPRNVLGPNGEINALELRKLPEGSPEWIAGHLATWPRQWERIRKIKFSEEFPEQADLWSLKEAAKQAREEAEWAIKRWPHVTTECIATDRVYWPGMGNALRFMTGMGVVSPEPVVTYRGLGREFAAVLLAVNDSSLRVALYNLSGQEKMAAIVPWLLEIGSEYELRIGPDSDDNGRIDQVLVTKRVHLQYRGQEVEFQLPSRQQQVLEMRKIGQSGGTVLAPDVAISAEDIRFVPEHHRVEVMVHNVGASAARNVVVSLCEGDHEIAREIIPNVEAPMQLDPQVVRISFPFNARSETARLRVVLDPDGQIEEITKRNNQAERVCDTPAVSLRRHSSP